MTAWRAAASIRPIGGGETRRADDMNDAACAARAESSTLTSGEVKSSRPSADDCAQGVASNFNPCLAAAGEQPCILSSAIESACSIAPARVAPGVSWMIWTRRAHAAGARRRPDAFRS